MTFYFYIISENDNVYLIFSRFISHMKTVIIASLLAITTLLLGCDGQAEDETNASQASDTSTTVGDPDVLPGQELNGGLTGKLITTFQSQPYEFDLSSGVATPLPLVTSFEFYNSRPDGGYASKWNFFAAGDSSSDQGYVETLYNCLVLPTGSCLSMYDKNYQVIKRVRVADRILEEPAKLSPSGDDVVMSQVSGFASETSRILLMDVDEARITAAVAIDNQAGGRDKAPYPPVVEWGHNDEIYYSIPADNRPTVYVTTPGTLDIARTIRLPQSYTGTINSLDIHPSGGKLLIEYRALTDNSASIVIVLDLTTLILRIPAVDQADVNKIPIGDDFISQFQNPMWSPDGRYIMFLNTFTTGVNPIVVPGIDAPSDYMVAVPSDSSRVIVDGWQGNNVLPQAPAIAIRLMDPDSNRITYDWPASSSVNDGHIEWID